jgi:hypothetical protein
MCTASVIVVDASYPTLRKSMQRMGQVTEGGSMSFYFASKFSTLSLFIIRIVFTLSVLVNLMASLWYARLICSTFSKLDLNSRIVMVV